MNADLIFDMLHLIFDMSAFPRGSFRALILLGLFAGVAFPAGRYQHIYIVHTNDIHGGLVPSEGFWLNPDFPPPIGNAAAAVTVIREFREQAKKNGYGFMYVDLGDLFSGTPVGEFSHGRAVIDYLNYAGCNFVVPGNHEFDQGEDVFLDLVSRSKAAFLCANIVKQGTDSLWKPMVADTIVNLGGIKVGLFGLLTHYMKSSATDKSFGGLDVIKHYAAADRAISDLKAKGADIIVALTHIGYSHDRNLADSIPGIDVILGGHSHTGLREPVETNRYHTITCQTYGRLTSVGFLDLTVDLETHKLAGYEGDLIDLASDEIVADTAMARMVEEWRTQAEAGFDVVLGKSKRLIPRGGNDEFPMGNLVTDAMREAFNGDIAVHTGVRGVLPQGDVKYRDVYAVDPFGNTVVTMTMTGKQVREMLEASVTGHHAIFQVSGLRMVYDPKKPINQRVLSVEVGGKPLDDVREYKVVTNSYLAAGAGEYSIFTQAKDIEDSFTGIREVLADYVKKHSPVDARIEGRIVVKTK
jgi:5'-nucleotidase